jgi:hypothetical protein
MYLERLNFAGQAVAWSVSGSSTPDHEVSAGCNPGATPDRTLRGCVGVEDPNLPTVMLTAKSVPALPAREDGGRIDYWDEKATGLVLRVTGKARTYCVWYA